MRLQVVLLGVLLCLLGSLPLGVGHVLSAPRPAAIIALPPDLPVATIQIPMPQGAFLAGWFVPGEPGHGGVLLLHGIGGDRRAMLGRARLLHAAGFTTLLIDLQAHGESPGERIGFGYREARDAEVALAYLRERLPGERLAIVGVSLGGAAAVLGDAAQQADAVVLEAVYPTFSEAVANRLALRLGPLGRWLAPLLTEQTRWWLGISPGELAPIDAITGLTTPLLIIAGSADHHTTLAESLRLYHRAAGPKSLWVVAGASHEDFHRYHPIQYQTRVLGLLTGDY